MTALLLLAGCNAAEPPLRTVNEIIAQCDKLMGKTVRAAGYLGNCAGYDCHLFTDPRGWDAAGPGEYPGIGIGSEGSFDRKAAPFQHSYVVITGRVAKDNCTSAGGTDRSFGIDPTDIRAWTPSEGAPAKTQ